MPYSEKQGKKGWAFGKILSDKISPLMALHLTSHSKMRTYLSILVFLLFLMSCSRQRIQMGVVKGELFCAPAVVADKLGLFKENGLKAVIIVYETNSQLLESTEKKELDSAYLDIEDALTLVAKGQADFRIIAISSRVNLKPASVLVTYRHDLEERILEVHRKAVRLLASRSEPAFSFISSWTRDKELLAKTTFDTGLDKAELIAVLEELRRRGEISPQEAESTARRLVHE